MSVITLNNQIIDDIIWEDDILCDFNIGQQTDIWKIVPGDNLSRLDDFLKMLTPGEIDRANKYYEEAHRNRFIISRASLRCILSHYLKIPSCEILFKLGSNKKPFIDHVSNLHFNVSDSGDMVLFAVSSSPIGIDVELINPDFKYHDIISNNFNEQEADYIQKKDQHERFYLLWTRKEAIIKATGIGLTDHLKQITALNGTHLLEGDLIATNADWELNSFKPDASYAASVATAIAPKILRFWNLKSYNFT